MNRFIETKDLTEEDKQKLIDCCPVKVIKSKEKFLKDKNNNNISYNDIYIDNKDCINCNTCCKLFPNNINCK